MKNLKYVGYIAMFIFLASTESIVFAETQDSISCEIECSDGMICVDAEVIMPDEGIVTGTLSCKDFENADLLRTLYGKETDWEYSMQDKCTIIYPEAELPKGLKVSACAIGNVLSFELSYNNAETSELPGLLQNASTCTPDEISDLLGIEAVEINHHTAEGGYHFYRFQEIINGVPTAWLSPVFSKYTLTYQDEYLTDVYYQGNFMVCDTSPVTILSAEEALAMVQTYADAGMLRCPPSRSDITRIQLCYYLEEIDEAITFRPVWVFSVAGSIWEETSADTYDEMIYIDAQDGLLLRYIGV